MRASMRASVSINGLLPQSSVCGSLAGREPVRAYNEADHQEGASP
jgi:hypothetical protein